MQYSKELIQPPFWLALAIEQHQPNLELRLAMSYEFKITFLDLMALKYWRFT